MRLSRLVPAAAAGALLIASVGPAGAATPGVGSTVGTLTVLGVDAGELLSLDLLSDRGSANTDPAAGPASAAAALSALVVDQPATGISETVSVFDVQSSGDRQTASQEITPIDNPLVSGSILPILLDAVVDAEGASSGVTAGVADLSVLGGVLGLSGTDIDLGAAAVGASADGQQGVRLDALSVLDLEALLAGVGIPLSTLSTDTVLALLDGLGVDDLDPVLAEIEAALTELGLDGVSVGDLDDVVDDLQGDVTSLEALTTALEAEETACLADETLEPALDLLGELTDTDSSTLCDDVAATLAAANAEITALTAQIDGLQALLDDVVGPLLEDALDLLAGLSLLSIDGLDVGVATKATDDVATSVADVTATLGAVQIGQLSVALGDALATGEQIQAVVDQVNGVVDQVLGTVDLSLADLIDIGLLEEQTSVSEQDGTIVSDAAFTGLRVDVLPITGELTAFIEGLDAADSIGAQLEGLGFAVPAAPTVLDPGSLLGDAVVDGLAGLADGTSVVGLSDGVSLRAASLGQTSSFTAAASPAAPQLPRTGSNDQLLLMLAAMGAAGALGVRRWMRADVS